jgi:hypothetical protein
MTSFQLNRSNTKRLKRNLLAAVIAIASVSVSGSNVDAQLEAGSLLVDARADQTVRVLAGSPFGNADDLELQLSAVGSFELTWEDEMGGTAALSDFTATFQGTDAVLGGYTVFGGLAPPASIPTTGNLANIDELNGELVSADFTLGTAFSIVLDAGPVIYTQGTAEFLGLISNSSGDVFTSPDEIDGYFALGGDIADDQVVAVSFNRTVTTLAAVPEPSSALIFACIGVIGCVTRRRS